MNEEPKKWYAARTRDKQELSIRDRLKLMEVEHFLPTRQEIRQLKTRKKNVEIPYIRNLIFIRATKQEAIDLPNKYGLAIFYIADRVKRGMLVVPDKQMHDFIQVMDLSPAAVSFDTEDLILGDKVKVVKGDMAGVEGYVASKINSTYVVIYVNGVLKASVKVLKSWLCPIE